jgi:hypothetical protein
MSENTHSIMKIRIGSAMMHSFFCYYLLIKFNKNVSSIY